MPGPNGETATDWLAQNAPEWVQKDLEADSAFALDHGITPLGQIADLLVEHDLLSEGDKHNSSVVVVVAQVAIRTAADVDTPHTADFMKAVPLEAAHQRSRWGVDHDSGKTPFDWFWLTGYLSQKAAAAAVAGDVEKAKHHTISTAGAMLNWHLNLSRADTRMRPGIEPPDATSDQG